jgi:hypothetical protein
VAAVAALGVPATAAAHDLFTAVIQHRLHVSIGARHIDLTIELTFFEEWSARERIAMDADADGRITRAELDVYLKQLAPGFAGQVTVRLAGQELPLAPLYAPEVELLGNETTIPGHHRLRLFFFAPTPPALRANDELSVEDRLWPEAKAMAAATVAGREGGAFEAERPPAADSTPRRVGEALIFKVRCRQPPAANPGLPPPVRAGATAALPVSLPVRTQTRTN